MTTSSRVRGARLALLIAAVLTGAGLTGCGTGGAGTASEPSPTVTQAPATQTPTHSTQPTTTTQPTTGQQATLPAGGPVPAGFAATSVTFTSATQSYVLGTVSRATAPSASIIRTLDRGAHWAAISAPTVPLGNQFSATGAAVWGIRFATAGHGFVFGNGLWETTNGGARWASAAYPGGAVLSVATIDSQVLILTVPGTQSFGAGTLYRRPLAGGAWHLVTRVRLDSRLDPTDLIATQSGVAAVLDGSTVVVTANGGRTFVRHTLPAAVSGISAPAAVGVSGPTGLVLVARGQGYTGHVDKTVYLSGDLGATWTKAGSPPSPGGVLAVAATSGRYVIAAASAASWLYYSTDGATWSTVYVGNDGGQGFADLGFTTPAQAVVIRGPAMSNGNAEARYGQLLLTRVSGLSWPRAYFDQG